jgi:hypothetical protein
MSDMLKHIGQLMSRNHRIPRSFAAKFASEEQQLGNQHFHGRESEVLIRFCQFSRTFTLSDSRNC